MKILSFLLISALYFSCGNNKSTHKELDSSFILQDSLIESSTDLTQINEPELLNDSVKLYKYKISDTIQLDLNCDDFLDKIYFSNESSTRHLIFLDGKNKEAQTFGNTLSIKNELGKDYSWVDFWGITKDTSTWEAVIKDGEILTPTTSILQCPSLVLRSEELGGGIITFKDGVFRWIHQAD